MAVKSKTALGRVEFKQAGPKTTRSGYGRNSRPRRRGKKPLRGQGN
jgi:hypothetical protein